MMLAKGVILMNKLAVLLLSSTLLCTMAFPVMAEETTTIPVSSISENNEKDIDLPDSVLYYGKVKKMIQNESDSIIQLEMMSDRYGEYIMNITEQTVWVDSGNHTVSDSATLQEGEGIYVFHSAVETRSLPPQSTAFAVVRNIPMDSRCAMYHEVEDIFMENGQWTITTNNGKLLIHADSKTGLSLYNEDATFTLNDIQKGDYILAWYANVAESDPAQVYASHIMYLPKESPQNETKAYNALTRAEFVSMMYEKAGRSDVHSAIAYTDVSDHAKYYDAVCWASGEGIMSGYGNGTFAPDAFLSQEQMITILWRYAGSPMLMDYSGLSQFHDVDEISFFAQPAFAWAHQKGYITAVENDTLAPQGNVSYEQAAAILNIVMTE